MTIINFILIVLLILPIYPVVTDLKTGKIKNYFIFPVLVFLFLLGFFIDGFYTNVSNIISIIIVLSFSYLFYINQKWGAGDGKYLILIGLSSIIIAYLKGSNYILEKLFISIFSIFLISFLLYIIWNFKKIKQMSFIKEKINLFDCLFSSSLIFLISFFISKILKTEHNLLLIFSFILFLAPFFSKIKYLSLKIFFILLAFIVSFYFQTFSLIIIFIIYIFFIILSDIFDQIFDLIDVKTIKIMDLQQGNILTNGACQKFKEDFKGEFSETPLQGSEVFSIISEYKKLDKLQENILIYKDIKVSPFMYLGFLLVILFELFFV